MKLRIEFRYATLNSLLVLLWLSTEYMIGLQDKFISIYPYVSVFALIIPAICIRFAISDKTDEQYDKITFGQALKTGLIVTAFSAILTVFTQLLFIQVINIDFLDNMANYAINHGQPAGVVKAVFSPGFYLLESAIFTLVFGFIISLILSWRMQTVDATPPAV